MKGIKGCHQGNSLYRQGDSGAKFYTDEEIIQKPIAFWSRNIAVIGEGVIMAELEALDYNGALILYKVPCNLYILTDLIFIIL